MTGSKPLFVDRGDAGRKLAARLKALSLPDAVVYALPRGGTFLAVEIAKALKAPVGLDYRLQGHALCPPDAVARAVDRFRALSCAAR